jgi:outer membrane receptor protein involved in Fe transport
VQLKASYEHTARLPEDDEMFGDGLLLQPNLTLKPERSHNFNVDILYTKHLHGDHSLRVDGGLIYRLPKNMIRIVAIGVTAQAQNQTTARVMGAEGTIRYGYKRRVNVELNATYQDIRNNNKKIDSYPDPLRLDRIPNIPYLFGNAMVGVTSNRMGESAWQVGFNWATMYVREFYLNWPSQGSKDSKSVIPNQISHDASVTVSSHGGKYNLSFSCWNLADSKLYDNYKVQKPGRSFNVKLRYYIARFKD